MAWARQDAAAMVRYEAVVADRDRGRDLAWARQDADAWIRKVAERSR
jgi:hypothetical protein